jgi:hypothetical protein
MAVLRRAFFRCQDDADGNLTVDILINERRRWVEKLPSAGWWGPIRSNNIWPFILYEGGVIDFGNSLDDPTSNNDRYGSIDMSDRIIEIGEDYPVLYHGHYMMTLERLTDLTDLPSIES